MNRGRTLFAALFLAGVLLGAGIGAGIAIDRLWLAPDDAQRPHRRGPPSPERLLERFRERLQLSDAQAADILPILRDVRADMRAVGERSRAARRAARERGQMRILQLLTPAQAVEYREFMARRERRRSRWHRDHPDGPPHHGPPHGPPPPR